MKTIHSILFILIIGSCAPSGPVTVSRILLGTPCVITAFDHATAEELESVLDLVEEIENKMHPTREGSDLFRVNQSAGIQEEKVSQKTFAVLKEALKIAELSQGAFDPTLGPVIEAWGLSDGTPRKPSEGELSELLQLVNYKDIVLNEETQTVFLKKKGMALDLGGIAKGYAADVASAQLKKLSIKSALIDFGGNIYVLGLKDNRKWRVGVQDPFENRGAFMGIIAIADRTIVTSGIYERFMELDGKHYHHILSSKTGYPVDNQLAAVTVIAESSMLADGISTTLFTLGMEKSQDFLKNFPQVSAMFIYKSRALGQINMNYDFLLTNEDFTGPKTYPEQ